MKIDRYRGKVLEHNCYGEGLVCLDEDVTKLEDQLTEARELVLEMLSQACLIHGKTIFEIKNDNNDISAFVRAQAKLIEWGMIKKEECVRK